MRRSFPSTLTLFAASLAIALGNTASAADQEFHFNRDVRPILSANCYQCHGPDKKHRKADLRLDQEDGVSDAFGESDLADNEAWQRLISTDDKKRMPPPTAHTKVKPEEKEIIKQWIAQGAKFEGHWSFVPPTKPPAPKVT